MLWIIGWIIFGFLIGLIARALYPGRQPMGFFSTMFLGVGGSLVVGFIGYLLAGSPLLQGAGWIGSLLGAIGLLAISQRTGKRRVEQL